MKRLAIVTTHPIQYNAPLFKLIQERGNIQIKVFYTWGKTALKNKFDPGFGKYISWDIPLLDGYEYSFEKNISANNLSFWLVQQPDFFIVPIGAQVADFVFDGSDSLDMPSDFLKQQFLDFLLLGLVSF